MKKLLKKFWQGDVDLDFAYVLATLGVISVPFSSLISFIIWLNIFGTASITEGTFFPFKYDNLDYEWLFWINFVLASIFLFLTLIILWRSSSKASSYFGRGLAKVLVIFPVLIYGVFIYHKATPPSEESIKSYHYSNSHYKEVTRQSMPTGARTVYSNYNENKHTRDHVDQIILDASEMDLAKWIRETKFRLNMEYWADQNLAKSDSGIREWRRLHPLRPDFKVPHTKVIGQISLDDYLGNPFPRLLKCDSRTMGKPEDKYYMQMCEALKNKEGVWLMRTSLGQRCCRLDVFAFEKEKLIWAIGGN